MKHRHRRQQQRRRTSLPGDRSEVREASERQPASGGRARTRVRHHQMAAEGGPTKRRLDKFRRGGRLKRFAEGGAANPGAPLSLNPADYADVGMNGQGQWVNSKTGQLLDQPPPLSESNMAYMRQAARNPQTRDFVNQINSLSELIGVLDGADATSIPGGLAPRRSGGRTQHQQRRRFDDGGIADASPAQPPALAYGNGPPPPPRLTNDGMPMAAAPPRANDPTFLNRQTAAQKAQQMKQRVKQLEGKGR